MQTHEMYNMAGKGIWLLFMFAFGACAGSLINVLVYRLPRGLGVATPASRCPACETRLTWRENIPVAGWLMLGGRCRFCKSRISAEYPLVELIVGLLAAGTFFLWYQAPGGMTLLSIDLGSIRPEWAVGDAMVDGWPRTTWPMFVVVVVVLCSLVAMTIVDAKTYTIPLQIPWFATAVGLVSHVGYAAYLSWAGGWELKGSMAGTGWIWSIPTPGGNVVNTSHAWWWIGASIGGIVGIGLSTLFLELGWIRRSFADYGEWEAGVLAKQAEKEGAREADGDEEGELLPTDSRREAPRFFGPVLAFVMTIAGLSVAGWWIGSEVGAAKWSGLVVGVLAAPVAAGLVFHGRGKKREEAGEKERAGSPAMWIEYPHARREMMKEVLFLTPCLVLGWIGGLLAMKMWGAGHTPPLWLLVLAGVLMGYLIGGGIIWGVRIMGSLAFGREAMGLGDVHLMGAVGACAGWIDAALALPIAAVVGLYWAVVSAVTSRSGGVARAMPFGPYLAAAVMVVIFAKPVVEMGLTALLGTGYGGKGINLP